MDTNLIERITDNSDLVQSLEVIRKAFEPVAKEFGLTPENCPTNAAFMKLNYLAGMKIKGVELYKLTTDGLQIGFMAIEQAPTDEETYYIEKVAVLPEHRHKGHGKRLVDFAVNEIKKKRAKKKQAMTVSIALVDNHIKLKDWYKTMGFMETDVRSFPNIPFDACFMTMKLNGPQPIAAGNRE